MSPKSGINYYRLRQNDLDGHSTTSKIISANLGNFDELGLTIFPNPVTDFVYVSGGKNTNQVKVVDLRGKNVPVEVNKQGGTLKLNLSSLSPGVYFIQIASKTKAIYKK